MGASAAVLAEDADEAAWQSARLKNSSSGTVNALAPACGRELGRWITPFRFATHVHRAVMQRCIQALRSEPQHQCVLCMC